MRGQNGSTLMPLPNNMEVMEKLQIHGELKLKRSVVFHGNQELVRTLNQNVVVQIERLMGVQRTRSLWTVNINTILQDLEQKTSWTLCLMNKCGLDNMLRLGIWLLKMELTT